MSFGSPELHAAEFVGRLEDTTRLAKKSIAGQSWKLVDVTGFEPATRCLRNALGFRKERRTEPVLLQFCRVPIGRITGHLKFASDIYSAAGQ